jgi:two-component system sensor histidine kinase/response regulator
MCAEFECLLAVDAARAAMHMHTLKGTAATLGAQRLSQAAGRLEVVCKQGNAEGVGPGELAALNGALYEALQALPQLLAALEPDGDEAPVQHVLWPVADVHAINTALDALEPLLQAGDMAAMEAFALHQGVLASAPSHVLEALETAMQNLEFENALAACREIRRALPPAALDAAQSVP